MAFWSVGMLSFEQAAAYRHFMGDAEQGLFGHIDRNTGDFIEYRTGFDPGDPVRGLALSLTHSGFEGFGANRSMRKDSDEDFTLAMEEVCSGYTTGLNLAARDPTGIERLDPIHSEGDIVLARGVAFHFAALPFPIFHSLWH